MSPGLISLLGQPLLWAALGVVFGPYLIWTMGFLQALRRLHQTSSTYILP
jgi:hypothetical protein